MSQSGKTFVHLRLILRKAKVKWHICDRCDFYCMGERESQKDVFLLWSQQALIPASKKKNHLETFDAFDQEQGICDIVKSTHRLLTVLDHICNSNIYHLQQGQKYALDYSHLRQEDI
ncbi:hypothetical protein Ddc_21126 [Ditylenchus destructor]|nr:hypothetical protein Ddc_21126 [Ditylenchus destructor]